LAASKTKLFLEKKKRKASIVSETYDFDDHSSQELAWLGGQGSEHVTAGLLQQLEGDCQVMVFQYRFVVVHQCQLRRFTPSGVISVNHWVV